jgi:PAS domain S-box-containing protein
MQLLAASGQTIQVNKAWEALWLPPDMNGLKDYVLSSQYNVLTDLQLQAKGITPYLQRAFAGESVKIPAIYYDPADLGRPGRARWVTANAHPLKDGNGCVQEVMLMHEDITDQIEAQTVLRNSEERFRSLVMATSQMIWTTAPDGRVLEDSPSWRAFTGQTDEEWKGHGWLDAVHPDDRERARLVWTESVSNKSTYETHYRLRRHDGQYRWTVVKGVPVLNPDGTIREWMGANTDVTEQRQTEQALQRSEGQLRLVLNTTQQKVFTATPHGDVDYFNPAWTDFTGLSFEEIRDWGWLKFIHPDDVEDNIRIWQHSIDTGEPFQFEHRFRRADGQFRWHLSRAVPLRDTEGSIIKWVGSNTDIHEIKVAETELEVRLAEETRNASLLKKVAVASRSLHTELTVDDIAQSLVEHAQSILEVHQAVVSFTKSADWSQAINAVYLSEKYARFRSYATKPDGSGIYAEVCRTNKPMRLTQEELEGHPAWKGFGKHVAEHPAMRGWLAVPLVGHDGKNLGLIQASDKIAGEFTEQDEAILVQLASVAATGFENARLYESLREQDRRKDEFLAMLAHELRNPLAPISAAAQLMEIAKLDEGRLKQTSQIISRQIRHMSALVDDLLDVSRVTRGLVTLNKIDLDIKRVVYEAIEQVQPLIDAKRHHLTVDLGPEPAHVSGDSKRLVQILANLLNNAVKYTSENGSIHVGMAISDHHVYLRISDNGIGIASEVQPHVFELFAQAKRTADRSQGGLGIGLAVVKGLVELHDGQVSCESEGPGKGSRFTVILPKLVHSKNEAPLIDLKGVAKSDSQLQVLVVDDNADAANTLAMLLEVAGHKVVVEYDPYSALERAGNALPDVCILDIGLPGMDGKELAVRLRANKVTSQSMLIALTGYGQDTDKKSILASGFDYHFVKPVDGSQLLELLSHLKKT